MSSERRYSDEQIAAIFKMASEEQKKLDRDGSAGVGLTLAELQEIGGETGISSEALARAAATFEHAEAEVPQPTLLGFPTGVSKIIELDHDLTEDEWLSLVAQFRDTFRAHGKLEQVGGLRTWRNGNLQISFEPTKTGSRLRMRTFKGDAAVRLYGSMAAAVLIGTLIFVNFLTGESSSFRDLVSLFALLAAMLVFVFPVFRLNKWAEMRGEQMDTIAKMAKEMGGTSSSSRATSKEAARGDSTKTAIPESAEGLLSMDLESGEMESGLDSDTIKSRPATRQKN